MTVHKSTVQVADYKSRTHHFTSLFAAACGVSVGVDAAVFVGSLTTVEVVMVLAGTFEEIKVLTGSDAVVAEGRDVPQRKL